VTLLPCEQCGYIGPHGKLETDCILEHPEHTQRYVGLLCRRHYHWIEQTLTQITELFSLRGFVLLLGASGSERSATRDGSPSPGRIEVMALTDRRANNAVYGAGGWRDDPEAIPDVPGALFSWVRLSAEEIPLDDELPSTFTATVGFLHHWRHWIAQQLWIDDYTSDLAALHLALARGIGDSMWPQSLGPCPNCGMKLYNTIGVDVVACRKCKSSWEGVHLARLRYILEPAK